MATISKNSWHYKVIKHGAPRRAVMMDWYPEVHANTCFYVASFFKAVIGLIIAAVAACIVAAVVLWVLVSPLLLAGSYFNLFVLAADVRDAAADGAFLFAAVVACVACGWVGLTIHKRQMQREADKVVEPVVLAAPPSLAKMMWMRFVDKTCAKIELK